MSLFDFPEFKMPEPSKSNSLWTTTIYKSEKPQWVKFKKEDGGFRFVRADDIRWFEEYTDRLTKVGMVTGETIIVRCPITTLEKYASMNFVPEEED